MSSHARFLDRLLRASNRSALGAAVVAILLAGTWSCSSNGNGNDDTDVVDTVDDSTVDAGDDPGADGADDSSVDPDVIGPVDHSTLCVACVSDGECGTGGVCLGTAAGAWCATPCFDRAPCPSGYACRSFEGEAGVGQLCVPEEGFCEDCPDVDDDGYAVGPGCGRVDCAPDDPDTHPNAEEVCNGRDDDCDGVADEEFDLSSDPNNCGACGEACDPDNASGACVRGSCELADCAEGFADCNGEYEDGCEASAALENACGGCNVLLADPGDPCGACGSGEWSCSGRNRVICAGDRGSAAVNACGGCDTIDEPVGSACGFCRRGLWVCDGIDEAVCDEPSDTDSWTECGDICCSPGEVCTGDACGEPLGCRSHDECDGDRWCDVETGACVTWRDGDSDEECLRDVTIAKFSPQVQCTWDHVPSSDRYADWVHVLATPMVADFDFEGNPEIVRPSIVFVTDDGEDGGSEEPTGLLRIVDGRTCNLQFTLTDEWLSHSSAPAVGDLDGDGRPEIVAFRAGGGLVAFRYVLESHSWEVWWTSHEADGSDYRIFGGAWGGPGLHDLDDDGIPEVLRGAAVFSNTGELLDDSLGTLAIGASPANMSFAADLDGDGRVEIAGGDRVWEWDSDDNTWVAESYVTRVNARGYVAVANFGDYAGPTPALRAAPELVVVGNGTQSGSVRVQTLTGEVVFGPISIPSGGTGGPPTVGDFDGDGRPEFAAAGRGSYTVFDLDCTDTPTAECASRRRDGILWTRTAQDVSSSQTGSSIFDFEGDGRAEAVYADECFVRVYDGESGDVIFSQQRSSCTWNENPVVADVDGDFNAELIVPANLNCDGGAGTGRVCDGLEEGGVDPQFAGLRCATSDDCLSGVCRSGFCRCTIDDQCCPGGDCAAKGFVCTAPPAGTPGVGDTCRAAHNAGTVGIRVYSDALDQWVSSRHVWNQHAYNVTNVEEDGTIPRTSDVEPNWFTDGLNNFRENVQGGIDALAAPDLTSSTRATPRYCDPAEGVFHLDVEICNRGTEPIDREVPVAFRRSSPLPTADTVCLEYTETILYAGECETVSCRWPDPPDTAPGIDVWVVPDPSSATVECNEDNNTSVIRGIYCD